MIYLIIATFTSLAFLTGQVLFHRQPSKWLMLIVAIGVIAIIVSGNGSINEWPKIRGGSV